MSYPRSLDVITISPAISVGASDVLEPLNFVRRNKLKCLGFSLRWWRTPEKGALAQDPVILFNVNVSFLTRMFSIITYPDIVFYFNLGPADIRSLFGLTHIFPQGLALIIRPQPEVCCYFLHDGPFIPSNGFDLLGEKATQESERLVDLFILFLFEAETLNRERSKLF